MVIICFLSTLPDSKYTLFFYKMNAFLCDFFDRLLWREYQCRQKEEDSALEAPDDDEGNIDEVLRELRIQTFF